MRKHISYVFNELYRAQPIRCDIPNGATDIQEFDSLEELKNSQGYIAYIQELKTTQVATDYENLDKIVKAKQIELGMDLSKEGLVQNGVLLRTILQTPIPTKTAAAFAWLQNLWDTKYFNVQEGTTVTFDDILPLEISYSEIAAELGFSTAQP